jgi:hypothetical protein
MAALTPKPFADYTAAEQEFIDQMARRFTVNWAAHWVNFGVLPKADDTGRDVVFFDYAKSKKWLSADGTKMLSAGFLVAARFLKR